MPNQKNTLKIAHNNEALIGSRTFKNKLLKRNEFNDILSVPELTFIKYIIFELNSERK